MLGLPHALLRSAPLAAAITFAAAASSHAAIFSYGAVLNGANVTVPVATPATGFANVFIDTVAQTMEVKADFADLLTPNTAAHIHCCTVTPGSGAAGVASITPTFTGFPTGATSGSYDHIFDLTNANSYNPAFVTANGSIAGAEAALLAGLASGEAYFTIHTSGFPGGEVAGFFHAVPEPETWALMILGFGLAGVSLRRRRALVAA